jgi:hypothetical protein
VGSLLVLAEPGGTAAAGSPSTCRAASATAVVDWNATTSAALATDAGLGAPLMSVGMSYVSTAVYNAVQGIERTYPLYRWNVTGPRCASTDAAVAAAARGVLLHYFPVSGPRVEAAYTAALDAVPDGPRETAGVAYGELAAEHVLQLRQGDGWQGSATFDASPAPGVWRPTPPAFAPFLAPWLATMEPFLIRRPDQFRPAAPPALTSRQYARDYQEVAAYGSATSTVRTAEQTEIARFFGGNLTAQLQGGYRDHITRHGLDASQAALYLGVANLTQTDALISCWDTKLHFARWRPVTAINLGDTDGNPATTGDPSWTPLLSTLPFPEYVSAHTEVAAAVTSALAALEGTSEVDLTLSSTVTGTTRHYATARQLREDSIGARIWAGIHFRTADEVGDRVGASLGTWIAEHRLS